MAKSIQKSAGVTATEEWLSQLCEQTFFGLWSYPNPAKEDGDELCDLLAVYDDHVFLFFDRANQSLYRSDVDVKISWERWKKKSIDAQIRTAAGAERYIRAGRPVILDGAKTELAAVSGTPRSDLKIHKIIVAHGAKEACLRSSASNVYGSLGVFYGRGESPANTPFMINLEKDDPTHVLDAVNLPIVLRELNTPHDFAVYIEEKERAIRSLSGLCYCGEEDLLAHYLLNYDETSNRHFIGSLNESYDMLLVGEGEWKGFLEHDAYRRRRRANRKAFL